MHHRPSRKRKLGITWVFVILGVSLILMSLLFLYFSHLQQGHYERWQAAPLIRETGELRTRQNQDVALVATIDLQAPTEEHGLALYEYWELESHYEDGEWEETWEHNALYDHKPDLTLLFYGQPIVVRSQDASLHEITTIRQSGDVELKGLSPGQEITVLGQAASPDAPFSLEADFICGGGRQGCLNQFAQQSTVFRIIGLGLLAIGIGLVVGRILWVKSPI